MRLRNSFWVYVCLFVFKFRGRGGQDTIYEFRTTDIFKRRERASFTNREREQN